MDQKTIMLFILGILLGGFFVMLIWLSSPGCINVDLFGGTEAGIGSPARELNTTPGLLVASDSSGRTITTTGQRGTPAEFIDPSGRARSVVCYTSVYCVDETPCLPCEEDYCVDNGMKCGYWPGQTDTRVATHVADGVDYGECCDPYMCYQGYCRPPQEEECVDYGDLCGRAQDPSVMTHVAYKEYGECCPPYDCVNNRCNGMQEECVPTREMCGYVQSQTATHATTPTYYGECCEPDVCINNQCTPPEEEECVDYGLTCGYVQSQTATHATTPTYYGECCPPYECTNNKCVGEQGCQEHGDQCEYGPNYGYLATPPPGAAWYGDCCSPLACIAGLCGEQCTPGGQSCKTSEECCSPLQCFSGICAESCSKTGEICIMDSQIADLKIPCCEGYCVGGYCVECKTSGSCTPGTGECCEGYRCWDFKCVAECQSEGSRCDKDSECCKGLVCLNGRCNEPQDCGEEGQTCGLGVECCGGLYCSENDVCTPCSPVGGYCGQYAAPGTECCPDAYCYMGLCEQKTTRLCTDTENGPDYYSQGTATGVYEGVYGTYADYCVDSEIVADYYCHVNNEYSPVYMATVNCPKGCSQGRCN